MGLRAFKILVIPDAFSLCFSHQDFNTQAKQSSARTHPLRLILSHSDSSSAARWLLLLLRLTTTATWFYSDEWLVGDPTRVAPHRDGEISRERMKCFCGLFLLGDDHGKVMDEYAQFSMKSGPFEDLTCISRMYHMDPKNWWANFGAQTPFLQSLAFKVLGQPTSSSCCKRNWSAYAFIHSLRRNKLNPSRAQDLVYIHNNLCLLSRNSDQYEDENTKMWDVGGDVFDSLEDVGFLESAELSLNEPDFENELLVED